LKFLGWLLFLAVAAVALALAGRANTGYVLIVAPPQRYELTLNFLILLILAGWLLLYLLARAVLRALALPGEVREFRTRRRRERAHGAIDAALLALLEGRYGKARQHAEKALALGEGPIAALLAARAAIEVRDFDTADDLLARIAAMAPQLTAARLIMDAEIELARHRPQTALSQLQKLRHDAGMHTAALRLELKALQAAKRWAEVPTLLEQLKRRDVLDTLQAEQLRWHAEAEHLASLAGDLAGLNEYWQRLPPPPPRGPPGPPRAPPGGG
jgi:HemY protein